MKNINKVLYAILAVVMVSAFGFRKSFSQVTDKDGNVYKTVVIGTQEWMAENLNVEHYRNGDVIPQVQDAKEWGKLTTGAWSYYNNDPANGKIYGKLYNWYAVNDPRGLAPEGWRIPSDEEWTQLTDYLGGESIAGGKMKATTLWLSPNVGATNRSGFSAFPGDCRQDDGKFHYRVRNDINNMLGYFWSSSAYDYNYAWLRVLYYNYSVVYRHCFDKGNWFSVRCVRD
ncbi:MAG: fibrobacter succinogenes major paralogous domain-containing protein [Ignavibacteriae bacterium]|nr:fibrobacter succinogenes major paralogous domain-containing protein [Ignavibacteriota bacterium]